MRRLTEAALECMREMEGADTRELGKILNGYLCLQIGLNVARDAADLPWREASAHIEQYASVTMAFARRFPIAGQLAPECFGHFWHRR
jgi:hypothetical protein